MEFIGRELASYFIVNNSACNQFNGVANINYYLKINQYVNLSTLAVHIAIKNSIVFLSIFINHTRRIPSLPLYTLSISMVIKS